MTSGLPPRYRDSVRAITPGLPLFLYNYSTHQLHGIFEVRFWFLLRWNLSVHTSCNQMKDRHPKSRTLDLINTDLTCKRFFSGCKLWWHKYWSNCLGGQEKPWGIALPCSGTFTNGPYSRLCTISTFLVCSLQSQYQTIIYKGRVVVLGD